MKILTNESGSAIVMAILILAALTIIGVSSLTTSTIETKVASNEMTYKTAFYSADGGTEVARELIEQNIGCPGGFQAQPLTIGTAVIEDNDFSFVETEPAVDYPSNTQRQVRFPADDTQPHTNIFVFGNTQLSTGSALQLAAGYEGKGKGAGSGGGEIIYNIFSRHEGRKRSRVCIKTNYRHIIGQEGNCIY